MAKLRALLVELGELRLRAAAKRGDSRPRREPFGPAIAWPAKVPTTISASAGSAERRISAITFRSTPHDVIEENHEGRREGKP